MLVIELIDRNIRYKNLIIKEMSNFNYKGEIKTIMDKVLHVLPMNKMSGAERMALLLCKNIKNYEPVVVCGGEELSNIFRENGIKSYNMKFSNKNILANAYDLK